MERKRGMASFNRRCSLLCFLVLLCCAGVIGQGSTGCKEESWCGPFERYCRSGGSYQKSMHVNCPATCGTCKVERDPRCDENNGGCEHACFADAKGALKCSCQPGYQLDAGGKNCSDINECLTGSVCREFTHPFCVNTPGGYFCSNHSCASTQGQYNRYRSDKCCSIQADYTCGRDGVIGQDRIVGGRDAKAGGWPWMVYILIKGNILCGGTLISPNWVVTAGHCFLKFNNSHSVKTFFSRIKPSASLAEEPHVQQRDGVEVILHPSFDKSKFPYHDIALIRLSSNVTYNDFTAPACLPNGERPEVGRTCWAVGYGTLSYRGRAADSLQEVDLPIVSHDNCSGTYAKTKYPLNKKIMFCAGHKRGGKDACQGDSGGALICQRCSSCAWYIAGVTSFGRGCARAGSYGVFTDVEVYEDWVGQITGLAVNKNKVCGGGPPTVTWTRWSSWSSCSRTCNGGTQSRSRSCPRGRAGVHPCIGSENSSQNCQSQDCPRWGSYGSWSACDNTCGGGKRTRTRPCNGGNPGDDGCNGDASQSENCNTHDCPTWGQWATWAACSTTCGGGEQSRTRNCRNGSPGATCVGDRSGKRSCQTKSCPQFSKWTSWGSCSKSCGTGSQTRTRSCVNGKLGDVGCTGSSSEDQDCNVIVCGTWDKWSNWGQCSVTCEGGSQSARRRCVGGTVGQGGCPGKATRTRDCSTQLCPVWGKWTTFSDCGVTCGGGRKTRTRVCKHGDVGMIGCHVGKAEMTVTCNSQMCPSFTNWSTWTACSVTCGGGKRESRRTCQHGSPGDDGCTGSLSKSEDCNSKKCPRWSAYGPWSTCTKTCGSGEQTRTRTCQHGSVGQTGCHIGTIKSGRVCNSQPCPEWTAWGDYSACSVTCNPGEKTRSRTCRHETANAKCKGLASETVACNDGKCPAEYGDFSEWGDCSVSCGPGSQSRSKPCIRHCTEAQTEMRDCNKGNCPVLSGWTQWQACTATCGVGTQLRERTCTGTASSDDCNVQLTAELRCFVACWGPYGAFSACSVTCGTGGTRAKTRTCNADPLDASNPGCSGSASVTENCGEPCPTSWGQWAKWSQCTFSCNGGRRTRERSCDGGLPGSQGCHPAKDSRQERACNEVACPAQECRDVYGACRALLDTYVTMCDSRSPYALLNCASTCGYCNAPPSQWGAWSSCSETCGNGYRQRLRTCGANPGCTWPLQQTASCDAGTCDGFTQWGTWSTCTVTCGGGSQKRSRTCPPGTPCLPDASGTALEQTQDCGVGVCPGTWADWTEWSTCSNTCGSGGQTRSRECTGGTVGGPGCLQDPIENRKCSLGACPGHWGDYAPKGKCSKECGPGRITEERACIGGVPGGPGCPGTASRQADCNLGACVTAWRPWAAWSDCTATCGGGTTGRQRTCAHGSPGDAGCLGSDSEELTCNTDVCQTGACSNLRNDPSKQCNSAWCLSFIQYMMTNCAKTFCECNQGGASPQVPLCKDERADCGRNAFLCTVQFYVGMMRTQCARTCGAC